MQKELIIATLGVCLALTGCSGVAPAESAEDTAKNLDAASVAKAIDDIEADEDGNVTIYLADGRYFDLGNLKGEDGKDGKDGKDGVGISGATINDNGELVLSLTDGSTINNGTVKGSDGKNGSNGTDGANGVGIQSSSVNENGELIITLTDGTTINNGVVQGKDGKDGKDGADGKDGRDGTNGKDGKDGTNGKDASSSDGSSSTTKEYNVGDYVSATGLPATYVMDDGAILHLEEYRKTIVEKHTAEELSTPEKRMAIYEANGLSYSMDFDSSSWPFYIVETSIKGYIENKSDKDGVKFYFLKSNGRIDNMDTRVYEDGSITKISRRAFPSSPLSSEIGSFYSAKSSWL